MKTVNEFNVSNGAKWLGIHLWNKCLWNWPLLQLLKLQISRLFRAQGAPRHSDNSRVYIHSKTLMWHDKKNTQLKNFLSLFSVLLIYNKVRHLRISMMEQLLSSLARIGSKRFLFMWSENISSLSYLLGSNRKSQEKSCLPNWFTMKIPQDYRRNILAYNICHWATGYCKTSDFFWLIFSISSPPSLTTTRFTNSSTMNTSVREFSKFHPYQFNVVLPQL